MTKVQCSTVCYCTNLRHSNTHPCLRAVNPLLVYAVVDFLSQLIFIFPLFLGMVMYSNEFKTKEKQKLTSIKNQLQRIHSYDIRLVL